MDSKCKICRRAGEKLFLKGDRCFTPKCAVVRKPYPPGIHTRVSKRGLSEFGLQLREKQKLRHAYHLREQQFKNYVSAAMKTKGKDAGATLLELLARRLDNVVFQAGFVPSRSMARQMISHGHVYVNGERIRTSSYLVGIGNVVSLSEKIRNSPEMQNFDQSLKKYKPPTWISSTPSHEATISSFPSEEDRTNTHNTKLIIEYYARV